MRAAEASPGRARARVTRERMVSGPGAQVLGGLLQRGVDVAEHVGKEQVGLGEKGEDLGDHDALKPVDVPREPEPLRDEAVAPEEEDEGERDQERGRDERDEAHERDEALAGHGGPRDRVGEDERHRHGDDGRDRGHQEALEQDAQEPPRAEELGVVCERQAARPRQADEQHFGHRPQHEDREQEHHRRGRGRHRQLGLADAPGGDGEASRR